MNKELLRTVKFVLFSASAGIVQLGSFALMNEIMHWGYWLSYFIALILSVIWNFTFNRKFTFKSASNIPKAMALVVLYYCFFTPISTLLEYQFADVMGWNEYLVTIVNMLLNLGTEFPWQRFVVFKDSIDTNEKALQEKAMQEKAIEENATNS